MSRPVLAPEEATDLLRQVLRRYYSRILRATPPIRFELLLDSDVKEHGCYSSSKTIITKPEERAGRESCPDVRIILDVDEWSAIKSEKAREAILARAVHGVRPKWLRETADDVATGPYGRPVIKLRKPDLVMSGYADVAATFQEFSREAVSFNACQTMIEKAKPLPFGDDFVDDQGEVIASSVTLSHGSRSVTFKGSDFSRIAEMGQTLREHGEAEACDEDKGKGGEGGEPDDEIDTVDAKTDESREFYDIGDPCPRCGSRSLKTTTPCDDGSQWSMCADCDYPFDRPEETVEEQTLDGGKVMPLYPEMTDNIDKDEEVFEFKPNAGDLLDEEEESELSGVFVIKGGKGTVKGYVDAPGLKAAVKYAFLTFGLGLKVTLSEECPTHGYSVAECDIDGNLIGIAPRKDTAKPPRRSRKGKAATKEVRP